MHGDVLSGSDILLFLKFYCNHYDDIDVRVQLSQSKNHAPRMELYCLMRNLIVALWFFNYKVQLV